MSCQLDATGEFLLQILLFAQHVSGTFTPIIRSSRVLYKWLLPVVFGAWFSSCRSLQTGHTTLNSTLYRQLENQAPNMTGSNHLYNTLEFLMMGVKVPETCWASNKICNKNSPVASSWHFISTYYWRCTVKTTSNHIPYLKRMLWNCTYIYIYIYVCQILYVNINFCSSIVIFFFNKTEITTGKTLTSYTDCL
jgi:hypothetical protein